MNWFRVCNVLAKTWGPLIPILLFSQWTNVIVKDLETYFINLSVRGEDISKLSVYSATTWCLPVLCTWSSSSFFSLHLLIENAVNVKPGNGVLRYLNDSIAPWILTCKKPTRSWLVQVLGQCGMIMSFWYRQAHFSQEIFSPKRFWRQDGGFGLEAIKTRIGGRIGASESWGNQRPKSEFSWRTRGLCAVGRPGTPGCYLLASWEQDQLFLWKWKFFCAHCIIYLISYLVLDKAGLAKVLQRYVFLQIQK